VPVSPPPSCATCAAPAPPTEPAAVALEGTHPLLAMGKRPEAIALPSTLPESIAFATIELRSPLMARQRSGARGAWMFGAIGQLARAAEGGSVPLGPPGRLPGFGADTAASLSQLAERLSASTAELPEPRSTDRGVLLHTDPFLRRGADADRQQRAALIAAGATEVGIDLAVRAAERDDPAALLDQLGAPGALAVSTLRYAVLRGVRLPRGERFSESRARIASYVVRAASTVESGSIFARDAQRDALRNSALALWSIGERLQLCTGPERPDARETDAARVLYRLSLEHDRLSDSMSAPLRARLSERFDGAGRWTDR
jgi:hypothetical protein